MNPPSAFQWREFYFVKIFHNVMKFVVPLFFMSISSMVSHQESCSVAMIINKLLLLCSCCIMLSLYWYWAFGLD